MSDQTTNPAGESEFRTLDKAADAFLRVMNPEPPKAEQAPPPKGEESNSEEAPVKEEAAAEDSVQAEQPEAKEESDKGEAEETILLIEDEEVPVSKLKEWRESGLRQADYTQKTQALAAERKAWEEQRAQEEARFRKEGTDKLAMFAGQVADELQQYANIDWDALRSEDPFVYNTKWADYQRAQLKAQQASQLTQKEIDAEKAKYAQATQQQLEEQAKLAVKLMPELSDPAKAQKLLGDMTSYMKDVGFTQEEIASISDAKALKVIKDAMQFAQLHKKGSEVAVKKVVPQTKILKPGSSAAKSTKQEVAQKQTADQFNRLRKSGRVEDAAALFRKMI